MEIDQLLPIDLLDIAIEPTTQEPVPCAFGYNLMKNDIVLLVPRSTYTRSLLRTDEIKFESFMKDVKQDILIKINDGFKLYPGPAGTLQIHIADQDWQGLDPILTGSRNQAVGVVKSEAAKIWLPIDITAHPPARRKSV